MSFRRRGHEWGQVIEAFKKEQKLMPNIKLRYFVNIIIPSKYPQFQSWLTAKELSRWLHKLSQPRNPVIQQFSVHEKVEFCASWIGKSNPLITENEGMDVENFREFCHCFGVSYNTAKGWLRSEDIIAAAHLQLLSDLPV